MKRFLAVLAVTAVATLLSVPSPAQTLYTAHLDGWQVVPARETPGYGTGSIALFEDNSALVSLHFYHLLGDETAAGLFGPAPRGGTANLLYTLPLGQFSDFKLTLTGEEVGYLTDGLLYFKVNTTRFPGGEIRGQVDNVPEPGAGALLLAGLLPLVGIALRPRRG
jgi:hypothetical protein